MKIFFYILRQIILIAIFVAVAILLSQYLLYDYTANDKTAEKSLTYERTEEIENVLAEDIDEEETNIKFPVEEEFTTGKYEVTNNDLNHYEKTHEYNPGKVDPFAATSKKPIGGEDDGDGDDENTQIPGKDPNTGKTPQTGLTK